MGTPAEVAEEVWFGASKEKVQGKQRSAGAVHGLPGELVLVLARAAASSML